MRSLTRSMPAVVAFWLGMVLVGSGQDFRIETELFLNDEKEPFQETLTVFTEGRIWDFLRQGDQEITLFDRDRNRLVLMDPKRKMKTELTMDAILSFAAQMKAEFNETQREFLLDENIEAVTDEQGWLTLANDRISYRVELTEPKEKSVVLEYQQFADWYARLNAMRGNLPPFMRIKVNAEVAKRGMIPKVIERTVIDKRGLSEKKLVVRSRHLANWRLSNSDRKQVDLAGDYLASFPTVSFREYMQLPEIAQNDEH